MEANADLCTFWYNYRLTNKKFKMLLIKYDETHTQNHLTKLAGIDSFVPPRPNFANWYKKSNWQIGGEKLSNN